jgi:hypothetical protein
MADVSLFIQRGWQNIWKQKTIWLFSALPALTGLFFRTYNRDEQNLALLCLYLVIIVMVMVLSVVGFIGLRYQAFNFSVGRSATVQETLDAVIIFSGRIIGCSALGLLLLAPCFLLVVGIALNNSMQSSQVSNMLLVAFLPLSIFSCLWDFSIFGFFENDWGIRQSIANAWSLFTSHFRVLALIGILMLVLFRICFAATGILTVLLQSGFDMASLSNLNYIDPSTTLGENGLFMFINGVNQIIFNTFSTSVFVLAYLKYRGVKIPSKLE